jgi:hypothetical protein
MTLVTKHGPSAVPQADYYEVPDQAGVFEWSPDPVPGRSPATQVHLHLGGPPGPVWVVRFKSPRTLSALIEALVEHRNNVWPDLCAECRGIGSIGVMRCAACHGKGQKT